MKKQQLDITLAVTEVVAIAQALETVRQTLPFLVGLTPLERRRLRVIGLKAQTFVEQALDVAEQYPEVVPSCLDVAAARRSLTLYTTLNPILNTLQELQELVKSTQMLAGSEAYASARLVYRSVKAVGKGHGLNHVVDDLARQFRHARRQSPEDIQLEENLG